MLDGIVPENLQPVEVPASEIDEANRLAAMRTRQNFTFEQLEERYEEEVVNYLFSRYRLPSGVKREMAEMEARETGELPKITLFRFLQRYPDFPMRLAVSRPGKRQLYRDFDLARLFSDFSRRHFVKAFEELEAEYGDELPIGLILRLPYLKPQQYTYGEKPGPPGSRGLAVHNLAGLVELPGVQMLWTSPSGSPLILEPLSTLLTRLDHYATGSIDVPWRPAQ